MNLNSIIQMITNLLIRKAVNKGVDMGIDYASRRGKPVADMTPEDHAQAQSGKTMAKRAKQAARLTRRL